MAEAKRTMFGIFELATETFRVDANPVHRWREALPKNKTQHKTPLEVGDIGNSRAMSMGMSVSQAKVGATTSSTRLPHVKVINYDLCHLSRLSATRSRYVGVQP